MIAKQTTLKILKQLSAWIICLALVAGVMQGVAVAANEISYLCYNEDSSEWTEKTVTVYTEIGSNSTTWNGNTTEGWYVVTGEVAISNRIIVTGDVKLILTDGCTLTASKGIEVEKGNSLTIYAQSNDDTMGKLVAGNGEGNYGAGIGGGGDGGNADSGTITIHGGSIEAVGSGDGGAGIGGGYVMGDANGGTVKIYGGSIVAVSSRGGAGIGGGSAYSKANGGTIAISGGVVTATGGSDGGAGIGGGGSGSESNGGTITISGGVVTATGGSNGGAGIGGGLSGDSYGEANGGDITISGGMVTATGGNNGAGIGGGKGLTASSGTFSTGTGGNAVVFASSISDKDDTTGWSGIIFEGDNGTVYGDVTLTEDLEIASDQTLTVPAGASLNVDNGVTLTNYGNIINSGEISNSGTINNNGNLRGNPVTNSDGGTISQKAGDLLVTGGTLGTDYTYDEGVLTVKTNTALTIANALETPTTTDTIVVASGVDADITLAGVNIDVSGTENACAFKIADNSTGKVTITLAEDTVNTLKSGKNAPASRRTAKVAPLP